jgi:Tol biopolymer transport system component
MRRLLRTLLRRDHAQSTRKARREGAVYVLDLEDGQGVPGSLRRVSPPGDFSQPMISPCGERLAYWGVGHAETAPRIWVSQLDGEPVTTAVTHEEGLQGHPFWHPDGARLVHLASGATHWHASRQFSPDRPPAHLRWLDTRTGASQPLTAGPWADERPAVAPDGRTVVFVSNRSGRLNLWRVDADGRGLEQLTDGAGPDYRPCVSPDGRTLAYFSPAPDGAHQVRLRSLVSGRELDCGWTRRFAWSHGPFWFGDGEKLLVHALDRGANAPALWLVELGTGGLRRIETPGLPSASHGTVDRARRRLACDSRDQPATV